MKVKLRLLESEIRMREHLISEIENLFVEREKLRQLRWWQFAVAVNAVGTSVRLCVLDESEPERCGMNCGGPLHPTKVLKNAPCSVETVDAIDVVDKVFISGSHRKRPNEKEISHGMVSWQTC